MATPGAAYFAAELRAARGRRNLTQVQLAELSGISSKTIARFENAYREARVGQIIALAKSLGIPARTFLPATRGRSNK